MSFKMEFHSKWDVTQNVMSLKWNITKMLCDSKWNVTQNGMSLKMSLKVNCHLKRNVTKY